MEAGALGVERIYKAGVERVNIVGTNVEKDMQPSNGM